MASILMCIDVHKSRGKNETVFLMWVVKKRSVPEVQL